MIARPDFVWSQLSSYSHMYWVLKLTNFETQKVESSLSASEHERFEMSLLHDSFLCLIVALASDFDWVQGRQRPILNDYRYINDCHSRARSASVPTKVMWWSAKATTVLVRFAASWRPFAEHHVEGALPPDRLTGRAPTPSQSNRLYAHCGPGKTVLSNEEDADVAQQCLSKCHRYAEYK